LDILVLDFSQLVHGDNSSKYASRGLFAIVDRLMVCLQESDLAESGNGKNWNAVM
jgi:hypothetical protein